MIDCDKCKFYINDNFGGECKVINEIECEKTSFPLSEDCPFKNNRFALMEYIIRNFGTLKLTIGIMNENMYFVVARVEKSISMFNSNTIEVVSDLYTSIENATADVLYRVWWKLKEIE